MGVESECSRRLLFTGLGLVAAYLGAIGHKGRRAIRLFLSLGALPSMRRTDDPEPRPSAAVAAPLRQ
ncbi:hypothetical protein GCM10027570_37080 [Streptomonospora sediminis]